MRPREDVSAALENLREQELSHKVNGASHPIESLYWQAKKKHARMLRRQSKTFLRAKDEYRRRYDRAEPWAFSTWFTLSKKWGNRVIDDYDDIVKQLAPFQTYFARDCDQQPLPPEFLERWHLLRVCFRHKTIELSGYQEQWFVDAFRYLVEEFKSWAPNVCILINVGDEPRVLLPPRGANSADSTYAHPKKAGECAYPVFEDRSHKTMWPGILDYCPATEPLPAGQFQSSFNDFSDLCRIGPSFPYGTLLSPETMRVTHDAVPILSTSSITPFSDVLFPSLWRMAQQQQYQASDDVDWYIKLPYVYWRGSTTGGYATSDEWQFHRQSLVQHLNNRAAKDVNVKFTDVIQCEQGACEIQNSTLPLSDRQPLAKGWEYKMVLDMDGNGASGRLYDLLLSKSLVLRHSFAREWHDQRLVPWLHYVPLSADYEQVDEVLDYFATPEGDKVGKLIADEGRKWANESMRYHEMKLHFFRLILEMGRDKRPPTWN